MLTIVLPDTVHTLGSHRVYIRTIHLVKTFFLKGVNCDCRIEYTICKIHLKRQFDVLNPTVTLHTLLDKSFN